MKLSTALFYLCYSLQVFLMRVTGISAGSSIDYRVNRLGNRLVESQAGVDFAGVAFILDNSFPVHAVVFAFDAYFRNSNVATFQLWRPASSESRVDPRGPTTSSFEDRSTSQSTFSLLSQVSVTPSGNGGKEMLYIASLLNVDCILVQPGDRLGVYSQTARSSFSYVFNATKPNALERSFPNFTDLTWPGIPVIFDTLAFPYVFSVAAYYYEVDNSTIFDWTMSSTSVSCPKELIVSSDEFSKPSAVPDSNVVVGPPGQQGPAGAPGSPGIIGQPGPAGPPGQPGVSSCNCDNSTAAHFTNESAFTSTVNIQWQADTNLPLWLNGRILIILVAWLAFLSVALLFVILCIIILCWRQSNNEKDPIRPINVDESNHVTQPVNNTFNYSSAHSSNFRSVRQPETATTNENPANVHSNYNLQGRGWRSALREESFHNYYNETMVAPVSD